MLFPSLHGIIHGFLLDSALHIKVVHHPHDFSKRDITITHVEIRYKPLIDYSVDPDDVSKFVCKLSWNADFIVPSVFRNPVGMLESIVKSR